MVVGRSRATEVVLLEKIRLGMRLVGAARGVQGREACNAQSVRGRLCARRFLRCARSYLARAGRNDGQGGGRRCGNINFNSQLSEYCYLCSLKLLKCSQCRKEAMEW
jgi:hypothetical protein